MFETENSSNAGAGTVADARYGSFAYLWRFGMGIFYGCIATVAVFLVMPGFGVAILLPLAVLVFFFDGFRIVATLMLWSVRWMFTRSNVPDFPTGWWTYRPVLTELFVGMTILPVLAFLFVV